MAARLGERHQYQTGAGELFQRHEPDERGNGITRVLRHQYVPLAEHVQQNIRAWGHGNHAYAIQLGNYEDCRMTCLCGCGQETGIWDENDATRGRVKGASKRWIAGHSVRKRRYGADHPNWKGGRYKAYSGYIYLSRPDHPRANEYGYVLEHILVAEQALGKYLPRSAQVHHVNGNRADNRGANLVICPSQAYHTLLHSRMRAKAACGNPTWLRCNYCGVYDDPAFMYVRHTKHYHTKCELAYQRQRKARKRIA